MNTLNEVIKLSNVKNTCKGCRAANYCMSSILKEGVELNDFDKIVKRRRPLHRGERLFLAGDDFHALYIIHSGSVKTYVETRDGEHQITGFRLPGDLLGVDGIGTGQHTYSVEALDTSSICELSFRKFQDLAQDYPLLQQQLFKLMSREITQEHFMMLLLGKMTSERRLAYFLMDMSLRMQKQGHSAYTINLSMTRHDIANYLGLALETVSRLLRRFQEMNMLDVARRNIIVKDRDLLQSILENCPLEQVLEKTA